MKKRITGVLLSLCLCLTLLPSAVFAADPAPAADTADFTAADGGAAALALLNAAKWENAEPSTWDSGSKTLTLKGLRFVTTAATAVKLPAGATIVLADGTHNTVIGGDAAVTQDGTYHNDIYIYGIFADGDLTIQGGTDRSAGSLTVRSGAHSNTGDAWTYSAALSMQGTLRVEGGETELTGGEARSADCAFSIGLLLPEGSGLSMTGGSLTAIGGRSRIVNSEEDRDAFSYGIEAIGADISVSGGKLWGKSENQHGDLSYGIDLSGGDLLVSGTASVNAVSSHALYITNGCLKQSGGSILASHAAGTGYALSVEQHFGSNGTCGSIEVTGGTLDASGGDIFMSQYQPTAQQGNLTVSGDAAVFAKSIFGAERVTVTGGRGILCTELTADELTLNSGRVTVLKLVREYNGTPYAEPVLWLRKLTVNGGELNASWIWNGITPIAFPADEYTGFPTPLVRMYGDDFVASFNGGTTILSTGCAGNTALKLGQLALGSSVVESGADTASAAGEHRQLYNETPVVFSDVTRTPVTVTAAAALDKPYDGTAAARLGAITFAGLTPEDKRSHLVSVEGLTAEFASKDVGTAIPVTVTGGTFVLLGANAYKYEFLTQPTDLHGLTASITYAVAEDTTLRTQTIRTGGGSGFSYPSFKGVGGEPTATGSVSYTYNVNDDTSLVYAIAEDAIPTMLNGLSAGDTAYIGYTFTGSGNYSPDLLTGVVTVSVRAGSPSTPSSSGSSAYPVSTPDRTENGSVSASLKNASRGDTVTITVKPDSGYTLESLTVTDANGNVLALTDLGDGKYSFVMPAGGVEVKATFMEDNSLLSFFYDVPNGAYYYEAVKWAVEKDITNGIGNSLFGSNAPCTRAQIVPFLWRAAGSPAPKGATAGMTDVASGSYYEKAVAWAIENGITTGTGEGKFSPDATCTRAQAVTFLARALNAKADSKAEFSDVPADSYFAYAVAWAAASGVTDGVGNGLFAPGNDCTRAQIVTFLYRVYNK